MAKTAERHATLLQQMDDSKITATHWKIMLISGMGFLTDAYDLFIIGVVMDILKKQWHPSATEVGLVGSTALLASAVGAVIFGRVADVLGRKKIYGYECLVLAFGAIATAFAPNILWLIVARFFLGVGIGGDYPVSATIMSEYAGKNSRGMMVSLVFTMQAAGLIIGPLIAVALLASHIAPSIVWRLLLGFGAIPALAVFWARRGISETPRFLLAAGKHEEFECAADVACGGKAAASAKDGHGEQRLERGAFFEGFSEFAAKRPLMIRLVGASLAWFLMDFAYYGNTVSSPLVLSAIEPHAALIKRTIFQLIIFAVAAAPGYFLAVYEMDKIGRRMIQAVGFSAMALSFIAIALMPDVKTYLVPFIVAYGVSYFFTEFGPNSTTFVYPSELFPVKVRTTGHGIAAAAGKIGGFVGVFFFPLLLQWHGLLAAESAAAAVSVLGLLVTVTMLPESKGKSLEELEAL